MEAREKKVAIGHFNISNTEGLCAVFKAAQSLNVPVIIGVSEGERDFRAQAGAVKYRYRSQKGNPRAAARLRPHLLC